jgi:formate dehydrogenase subunit delta
MSQNELRHLVSMANQIAANMMTGVDEDEAAAKVARHIKMFWAPTMRKNICDHLDSVRDELSPVAAKALTSL